MITLRSFLVLGACELSSLAVAQSPEWIVFEPDELGLPDDTRFRDVLIDRSNRAWVAYTLKASFEYPGYGLAT